MAGLLAADVGLVASYVLAGGTLTGKYLRGESGRASGDDNPVIVAGNEVAVALSGLAETWGVSAASLAFSFALCHPHLVSVLFGATSEEQVEENIASLQVFETLDESQRAALAALGRAPS
jgi:aryl-alcohol dehydrogenase-like predicted oxidoreductase